MKIFCLLFLIILYSCNSKTKVEQGSMCIKKITYIDQTKNLVPSSIRVEILDSVNTIRNAAELGKIKQVFFYSINKKLWKFYTYYGYKNSSNKNVITLICLTSIYDADKKHKWITKEVEYELKQKVGIVIGKDTLKINSCRLQQDFL